MFDHVVGELTFPMMVPLQMFLVLLIIEYALRIYHRGCALVRFVAVDMLKLEANSLDSGFSPGPRCFSNIMSLSRQFLGGRIFWLDRQVAHLVFR